MVIRELVARIGFSLNKGSVKEADAAIRKTKTGLQDMTTAATPAMNRLAAGINRVKSALGGVSTQTKLTDAQLREMGAFQDKLGRWHSKNGKFIDVYVRTNGTGALGAMQSQLSGLTNTAAMVGRAMVAAFAIDRVMAFASAVRKSADEMMNLDGRLRTVTKSDNERFAIEDNLYKLAQNNRQDMGSVGDLFYKVSRGAAQQGFTNDDSMRLTDIVSKSLTVGGASTAEASSTILQLSQALGSGVLQGDELHSLNENASFLMENIAKNMGVTIGDLKQMGSDGELTSKKVIEAILASGTAIDGAFGKMPVTIGQAMQMGENAFNRFVQVVQRNTNIFGIIAGGIAGTITFISDSMETMFGVFNQLSSLGDSAGGLQQLQQLQQEHPILLAIYDVWTMIRDTIQQIGKSLQPVRDVLSNLSFGNSAEGISAFKATFAEFLNSIVFVFDQVGPIIASIITIIQPLLPVIGLIAQAFMTVGTIVIYVLGYVLQFIAWLLGGLQEILPVILVVGAAIWAAISAPLMAVIALIGLLVIAWQEFGDEVVASVMYVVNAVMGGFEAMLGVVAWVFELTRQLVDTCLIQPILWVIDTISQLVASFGSAAGSISGFCAEIGNAIESWITSKIDAAIGALQNLKSFAGGVIDGIKQGVSNAYTSMTQNNTYNLSDSGELYAASDSSANFFRTNR